jgi:hypothetical protein
MSDERAAAGGASVELLADRGAAAESDEFFRSRPFLDAEGVTHTLRVPAGGMELLAPLIVREIPAEGGCDAVSPYGYPGVAAAGPPAGPAPPLDPATIDFASTGLVTIFLRHTLAEPPLSGTAARNVVQIADPALAAKSRGSDRNQINRNRRAGYAVELVPGPDADAGQRAGFLTAYEETMRRAGAGERYFFGAAYFDRIFESPRSWLAIARAPAGGVAAASVVVHSDGFLHYYLSGTADAHLGDSPMKNVVAALIELSAERGVPLNLGGGLSRGDRLEEFKRGFANREQPWHVSEIVCDRAAYDRLSAGHPASGFFPAYRGR